MSILNIGTLFNGVVNTTRPQVQVLQAGSGNGATSTVDTGFFGCGNVITNITISSTNAIPNGRTFSIVATNSANIGGQTIYASLGSTFAVQGPGLGNPLAQDSWLRVQASEATSAWPVTLTVSYLSP